MDTHTETRKATPSIAIVLEASAPDTGFYAATELRHYLERMSASLVPIVVERPAPYGIAELTEASQPAADAALAAGQRVTLRAPEEADAARLGEEGYRIVADDAGAGGVSRQLTVYGGKRGIIYGVYELLEALGCRFLTPTAEHVPVLPALELPLLDVERIPALEYRFHNYSDLVQNPRFAVKRRINAGITSRHDRGHTRSLPIDERIGGQISYAWFVHSFEHILDPAEHFDAHPEYFSEVNGKRLRERPQLCLTNPDVLRITIEKVRETLEANPDARLISVSQNDWSNPCTCASCREIDEAEGSHSGSLLHFVNAVAEAIEPDFPDVVVDTLAYMYTRRAPRHVRARPNVCVRLCTIEACFMHPLDNCDDRSRGLKQLDGTVRQFIEDLREWGRVCRRLYIWDYTTCFAHYPMPFPNWNVLQPNIRSFVENGVRGVFEQANGASGGGVDLNELRSYLITSLLWNPELDVEATMMEFLTLYYGAAAPAIRRYIQALTDAVEDENIHVGFNDQCDRPYLTDERLDAYEAMLAEAAEAVSGDTIRAMRVDRARLALRWVRMKNASMRGEALDPEAINAFFTDWRAHGLTRIDEWVSAETTHHALLDRVWRGSSSYFEGWWEEGGERF